MTGARGYSLQEFVLKLMKSIHSWLPLRLETTAEVCSGQTALSPREPSLTDVAHGMSSL